MTTHRPPLPDDPSCPSDPYAPQGEAAPPPLDFKAWKAKILRDPDTLRAYLEGCAPLERIWPARPPTLSNARVAPGYHDLFPWTVEADLSPEGMRAALELFARWHRRQFEAMSEARILLMAAALYYGLGRARQLREVARATRGDAAQRWTPLPWTILDALEPLVWTEGSGFYALEPRAQPATIQVLPTLRNRYQALRAAFHDILHLVDMINRDCQATHGVPLAAQQALDEWFDGPRLLGLRTTAAASYAWLDGQLEGIEEQLKGTKPKHVEAKPQNLAIFRHVARALALQINDNLPRPQGDRRAEDGRFRIEVRERTNMIMRAIYGVTFSPSEFKHLLEGPSSS